MQTVGYVITGTGLFRGKVLWGAGLNATRAECADVLRRNRKAFLAMVPGCGVAIVRESARGFDNEREG